jgi:hypothetical protein
MCSYQTLDTAGTAVTLNRNDRITAINGQVSDYIVDSVKPERAVTKKPRLKTWPIVLEPTSLVNGDVVAGTAHTLAGQVKFEEREKQSGDKGPNAPCTQGYFLVRNADRTDPAILLRVFFADPLAAQSYANAFAVAMVNLVEVGADPDGGDPGTITETPVTLAFKECELVSAFETRDGQEFHAGGARVVIAATEATVAELKAAGWFTVTPSGQATEKYTLSGSDGIKQLPNTHYQLSLKRRAQ